MTNLLHVDVVQLLDGGLDLRLVGADVDDEDEGVGVLNLLHRGFSGKRMLDDGVGIQPSKTSQLTIERRNDSIAHLLRFGTLLRGYLG